MAHRLLRAGFQYVQGFAVNVANRQTTRQSYRLVGSSRTSSAGAEFVTDNLPQRPRPSSDESDGRRVVNPRRQALGQAPTAGRGPGRPRCSGARSPASRTDLRGRDHLSSLGPARRLTVNSPFVPAEVGSCGGADVSPTDADAVTQAGALATRTL